MRDSTLSQTKGNFVPFCVFLHSVSRSFSFFVFVCMCVVQMGCLGFDLLAKKKKEKISNMFVCNLFVECFGSKNSLFLSSPNRKPLEEEKVRAHTIPTNQFEFCLPREMCIESELNLKKKNTPNAHILHGFRSGRCLFVLNFIGYLLKYLIHFYQ